MRTLYIDFNSSLALKIEKWRTCVITGPNRHFDVIIAVVEYNQHIFSGHKCEYNVNGVLFQYLNKQYKYWRKWYLDQFYAIFTCNPNTRHQKTTTKCFKCSTFESFFLISINQMDQCHTSTISSKGGFIHLFENKLSKNILNIKEEESGK